MSDYRISNDDIAKILSELGPQSKTYHESVIVRAGHDLVDARMEIELLKCHIEGVNRSKDESLQEAKAYAARLEAIIMRNAGGHHN